MIESYQDCFEDRQPVVLIYPGFLNLRLFDKLYEEPSISDGLTVSEKVIGYLRESPRSVRELQEITPYKSRSRFLEEVIDPLIESDVIYRDGKAKSPTSLIRLK